MRPEATLTSDDDSLDYLRSRPLKGRIALVLLILLGVGAVVADRSRAAAQRLWVVNGGHAPLSLSLDSLDEAELELAAGESLLLEVPAAEGTVTVRGGVEETIEFSTAASLLERWRGRRVTVINPGGLAVLAFEEARYGPDDEELPPRLLAPSVTLSVNDVDLVDSDFPETTSGRRLTRVVQRVAPPHVLADRLPAGAQLQFLAAHVAQLGTLASPPPAAAETLTAYRRLAAAAGESQRARELLRENLTPNSSLTYHRAHQDAELAAGEGDALLEHYTGLHEETPNDAQLAYLVARLSPDALVAEAGYENALTLDPKLAYAHHGLAYVLAARGSFSEAVASARRAVALAPQQPEFAEVLWLARLGAGEASLLLDELQLDPFSPRAKHLEAATQRRVLELVATRDLSDLPRAVTAYLTSLAEQADERVPLAAATAAELTRDAQALLRAADSLEGDRARRFRLLGLLAAGPSPELTAELEQLNDPWVLLQASFVLGASGDSPGAKRWRSAAGAAFQLQGPKGRALASGLSAAQNPDHLPLPLRRGALYCAVLAQAFPEQATRYRDAARRRLLGALSPVPTLRGF